MRFGNSTIFLPWLKGETQALIRVEWSDASDLLALRYRIERRLHEMEVES